MKKFLLTLALLFAPASAFAQCNGVFPAQNVCGSAAGGIPGPLPTSSFALAPGGTSGNIQINNGTGGLGGLTDAQVGGRIVAGTNGQIQYNNAGTFGGANSTVLTTAINAACTIAPTSCITFFNSVSPYWYGAKCDGTTHDETALQAALTAAITAASPLLIPAGVNCISNANLTNSTNGAIILINGASGLSRITFLSNFGFSFTGTASYYNFINFAITCQTTSNSPCLSITNATQSSSQGSVFQHLFIIGGVTQLNFQNMVETTIAFNIIESTSATGTSGISIDNTQTADVGANFIQSNTIVVVGVGATSVYGIFEQNCGGTQTQNNAIGGYSYDIYNNLTVTSGGVTGLLIQGNQLDNYSVGGIYFNSTGHASSYVHVAVNNNTIHANQATGAGSLGIAVSEAPGSITYMAQLGVTNNVIDTFSGTGGILVAGSSIFTVTGNVIGDEGTPTNAGIKTNASSGTCMVIGNAVGNYSTKLTNLATCATSGGTN